MASPQTPVYSLHHLACILQTDTTASNTLGNSSIPCILQTDTTASNIQENSQLNSSDPCESGSQEL